MLLAAAGWLGCGAGDAASGDGSAALPGKTVVGPVVAVGERGYAVAGITFAEGEVWVAGGARRGGVVSRVESHSGRLIATLPVPYDVVDIAAGGDAVWVAGAACLGPHPEDPDVCWTEPRVSRIEPEADRVASTIVIPRPRGTRRDSARPSAVAVGEGAVWVAVSWNPGAGEVIRVDPRTNAIAARIPTGGYVGELRVAAGSVWVLSHREYTDETKVPGASLLRIDPSTNSVVARPVRDELTLLGAALIPPVLAAGANAVWVTSPSAADPALALRVDPQTNRVTREHPRVERFYPIAVDDDAVWYLGSAGRTATLAQLHPETLEPRLTTKLPISAVRAAFDPSRDTVWIASLVNRSNEKAKLVRVDIR